jgi:16S rRNA (uracil1498-N3)-methyltransferase
MHLFYDPSIKIESNSHQLSEEESKHACKVMRLQIGDQIQILDGVGQAFTCEIVLDNPKKCEVKILSFISNPKDHPSIHIAIAPTKNIDRIEWFLEKATEIGITEITPIICSNSERKVIKEDRLLKIIVAAMKQSKRLHLPKLNPICTFNDFIAANPKGLIAHCYLAEKFELENVFENQNCPILIGPEGDFSEDEVSKALLKNYKTITLGNNRLRTETAGLYAVMKAKIKT